MKKIIPNILSFFRIITIPFLIIFTIHNEPYKLIILAILIALSDIFDGALARKWGVGSRFGQRIDFLANKLMLLSLLIILIIAKPHFFYILLTEFIITILNLYFYLKNRFSVNLLIEKIRTWTLFMSIIGNFLSLIWPIFNPIVKVLLILISIMQLITIINYILYPIKHNKEDLENYLEFYEIIKPFVTHPEFLKRKTFEHHINESVYEHTLRVSFDCFCFAKKFHLDYKSVTIAGILHDFYETPWQTDKEKHPFFKQHAFTHANNAVINAKKYFGKKITKKISMMMQTHMFPINPKLPKSKEAWLLTFIDKVDSIDFLLHPVELLKIILKNSKNRKKFNLEQNKNP